MKETTEEKAVKTPKRRAEDGQVNPSKRFLKDKVSILFLSNYVVFFLIDCMRLSIFSTFLCFQRLMIALFFQTSTVFCMENVPSHMVPLGEDVFMFPTLFKEQVFVHIRQFKPFGNKMYPTKAGIHFPPETLPECFTAPNSSSTELAVIVTEDICYKVTRGNKSFTLSCEQWNELQKQQRTILQKVLIFVFSQRDFIEPFEFVIDGPLKEYIPESIDMTLGTAHVLVVFKRVFKETVMDEGSLKEPDTMAEELWGNDPNAIYSGALSMEVTPFCNMFYCSLKESEPHLCLKPHMYVTKMFFKSLPWETMLEELFEFLCPKGTFEYFQCVM